MQNSPQDPVVFSAESYFATQPPPLSLDVDIAAVRSFVRRQLEERRRVVLVTVSMELDGSRHMTLSR